MTAAPKRLYHPYGACRPARACVSAGEFLSLCIAASRSHAKVVQQPLARPANPGMCTDANSTDHPARHSLTTLTCDQAYAVNGTRARGADAAGKQVFCLVRFKYLTLVSELCWQPCWCEIPSTRACTFTDLWAWLASCCLQALHTHAGCVQVMLFVNPVAL